MAKKPKLNDEIGQSGTYLSHGYLSLQDYNLELTGPAGVRTYDKMRKNDATVRTSLMAIVKPVLAAHWYFEPAGEGASAQDKEIADFLDFALLSGDTGLSWRHFLEESVKLYLAYGRAPYEKVFSLVDFGGKTYVGWERFALRHPASVLRWAIGEGDAERFGVTQQLPTAGLVEIPAERLIILVNEKEGDNWEGVSLLRSSYKNWYIKDQLYKIDAIKAERQGLGIPIAQAKPGFTPSDRERSLVQATLRNLRANENAFAEAPAGYDISFMEMKASGTFDLEASIEHHDRQIMKNVMAQFLEIGGKKGTSGSLSASDNQMDLFILSIQAVAQYVCEAVQQYAVKQLVDINWPGYGKYPELKVDKIGPDNAVKLADLILKGVQSHVLTPSDDDEKFFRSVAEMPEFPKELEGTVDRSFQPTLPPEEGDGTGKPGDKAKPAPAKPEPKKKDVQASESLAEVKALRDEVRAALYGS